jgi:hypothetical protein
MTRLSPSTLKAFLAKNQRVTVRQIQMHFEADYHMLEYLLEFWQVAGLIKVLSDCGSCRSCPQADSVVESYFNE